MTTCSRPPGRHGARLARHGRGARRRAAHSPRLHRITAPVGRVVCTARRVEVGNLAAARSALLDLAAGPGLVLRVPVSEARRRAPQTRRRGVGARGCAAQLALSASITRVFPAAEGTTRQVTVEARPAAAATPGQAGIPGSCPPRVERRPDAVLIPEPVLQRGSEVADLCRCSATWLAFGRWSQASDWRGKVVIRKGLVAGDEVVVEGLARLRDGGPVRRLSEGGRP